MQPDGHDTSLAPNPILIILSFKTQYFIIFLSISSSWSRDSSLGRSHVLFLVITYSYSCLPVPLMTTPDTFLHCHYIYLSNAPQPLTAPQSSQAPMQPADTHALQPHLVILSHPSLSQHGNDILCNPKLHKRPVTHGATLLILTPTVGVGWVGCGRCPTTTIRNPIINSPCMRRHPKKQEHLTKFPLTTALLVPTDGQNHLNNPRKMVRNKQMAGRNGRLPHLPGSDQWSEAGTRLRARILFLLLLECIPIRQE